MFCSSCGTECPLSAKFCGHCGHRINDVTQNTTRKVDEGGASGGPSIPLTFKQFKVAQNSFQHLYLDRSL